MKNFKESDFVSFTISAASFCATLFHWSVASEIWSSLGSGQLFGNRPDGSRVLLDMCTVKP